ncbi:HAD family phosphatase [Mucilaginibacter conchicola]|uniref:HAD family phosphatase n=2 Tax=Mucilaginibacter conchicola TaxID=2303333 RepID=A0A372NVM7_9SPHI|nr:HAD family phosphatase [Mucilaginibacter conchicola]
MYRTLFDKEEDMLHFLANITTSDWNEEQDAGRSLQEGTELLVKRFPEHEANIRAFYGRWNEMLGDAFDDTVAILKKLKESGKYKIYALTNWSAETFPVALERFEFLRWFDGIVVSGTEKMRKPAPEFYHLLLTRYHVKADEALFIDDNLRNVLAAEQVGIKSIHYQSAEQLAQELSSLNIF